MNELKWCSDCKVLYERGTQHKEHKVVDLAGNDEAGVIIALDEIIQYALDILQNREQEVENATQVKNEIDELRKLFLDTSKSRINRICEDVRSAFVLRYGEMLKEINASFDETEMKAKVVIASNGKSEVVNKFIQQAATVLPDDDGKLDPVELGALFQYYTNVKDILDQPQQHHEKIDVRVNLPSSLEERKAWQELAKKMSGVLDNPKRNSFLHFDDELPPEEKEVVPDLVTPLRKPLRKQLSKDLCIY